MATRFTREILSYMRGKMENNEQPCPPDFDLEQLIDCNIAVSVLKLAFSNQLSTTWSVLDLNNALTVRVTGHNKIVEDKITGSFPPLAHKTIISEPTIVTDNEGRILFCYLPNVLSKDRYDSMWHITQKLNLPFKISPGNNWRSGPENFRTGGTGSIPPGNINISPAAFMQGHTTDKSDMYISTPLQKAAGAVDHWIIRMYRTSALLGGILGVIHPAQFEAGCASLEMLNQNPALVHGDPSRLRAILQSWAAPFHGLSIMSNRKTPPHRDTNGLDEAMDLLVPMGEYRNGIFKCHTLGLTFEYNPLSVVLLLGKIVRHEATVEGNRACVAFYSRKLVHRRIAGAGNSIAWATI